MFANKYLEKQNNIRMITGEPDPELGMVVVIPCLNEPDIFKTLESLRACELPEQKCEVIVLINHSELASREIKEINQNTKNALDSWSAAHSRPNIQFYGLGPIEFRRKWAGAGLARKAGMDEAVTRFNQIGKGDGIIVSLDADTLVMKNYLQELEIFFRNHERHVGATIDFEHDKHGLQGKQLEGIELYENYLRYYKKALGYTGYPYSMFTIGSAFAVRAEAYVRRGGMNRRQAGEDFYFLQNLVQLGEVGEIKSTRVLPSARLSDRVPFGTGPVLQKWMDGEEDLRLTYNFQAFSDLKLFFDKKNLFFKITEVDFWSITDQLPEPLNAYLKEDAFFDELDEVNRNCSSLNAFTNRFFQKFNAFKVLKYMNFVHDRYYSKADLQGQIKLLNNNLKSLNI